MSNSQEMILYFWYPISEAVLHSCPHCGRGMAWEAGTLGRAGHQTQRPQPQLGYPPRYYSLTPFYFVPEEGNSEWFERASSSGKGL